MKLVDVRISSTMSGVPIKNQTIDRALDICAALIGADGIKRITIEWDPEETPETPSPPKLPEPPELLIHQNQPGQPEPQIQLGPPTYRNPPEPTQYPEQDCAIIDHPDLNPVQLLEEITQPPEEIPQTPEEITQPPEEITQPPEDIPVFTETERIPKGKLGKFTDLGTCGLGYHSTKNGLVICCGTTKVYTTWNVMETLPYPIKRDTLKHLNKQKRDAISHFSEWIRQGKPKIYKDPDAEFRQMLIPETRPSEGGNYENTSGEYD